MQIVFDIVNFIASVIFSVVGIVLTVVQIKMEQREKAKEQEKKAKQEEIEKKLQVILNQSKIVADLNENIEKKYQKIISDINRVLMISQKDASILARQETIDTMGEAANASFEYDKLLEKLYHFVVANEDELPASYSRYIQDLVNIWSSRYPYGLRDAVINYTKNAAAFVEFCQQGHTVEEIAVPGRALYDLYREYVELINKEIEYINDSKRVVNVFTVKAEKYKVE